MNQKTVTVIEPRQTILGTFSNPHVITSKKRVCAYARVSTNTEDQLNSFNVQKSEYEKRIKDNRDWEFVELYADEGISGTSIKKRASFTRMIDDARNGEIDLILTKSLSRFARNTVDTLTVIRELRQLNVEVYFEKENLSSSDTKVDFLLTIFSSIAQEESRNISENVKWGVRKRFKEGKVHINTRRFLGYDKDENDKLIINEGQAKVVRLIFNMYISGKSAREIGDFLTNNNFKNGRDKVYWKPSSIYGIISNEKYCGDAILQKRVTVDYLTHKSVKNQGHAPMYYIKNNHPPIIERKTFELVQELRKKRANGKDKSTYGNKYPLSGKVICAHCGNIMYRHYYNYGKSQQRIVLSCKNKHKNTTKCINKAIDSCSLEKVITHSIKKLNKLDDSIVDEVLDLIKSSLDSSEIQKIISEIKAKIENTEDDLREIISTDVKSMKNSYDFYKEIYTEKKKLLLELKNELDSKKSVLTSKHQHGERLSKMREFLLSNNNLDESILSMSYMAVISISQNEVILVMNNENLSKDKIINNVREISNLKSVITGSVKGKRTYNDIKYKVVKVEVNNESS